MKNMLYIHIPFCQKKCFYCSFVVTIGKEKHTDDYLEMLNREMSFYEHAQISSIYIGGGTPSMLNVHQIKRLGKMIDNHFIIDQECERTFEMNPESVKEDKLLALNDIGINRISLGVQTFDDGYLSFLGRNHTQSSAVQAVKTITDSPINNFSVDLMFGFKDQTIEQLTKDLDCIMGLNSQHISLYGLTLEPKSKFYKKDNMALNSDLQGQFYRHILTYLKSTPFNQYEISNFSLPGFESKHNIGYWTGVPYIGLGIGAHSFFNGIRSWNLDHFQSYLDRMKSGHSGRQGEDVIDQSKTIKERISLGLRMNKGIHLNTLERQLKIKLDSASKKVIDIFVEEGFLKIDKGFIMATDKGRLVLDDLSARIWAA